MAPTSARRIEEVAIVLAAQAAVAIENARLYESVTRWMRQLESMDEIGQALVSRSRPPSDARADLPSPPRARRRPDRVRRPARARRRASGRGRRRRPRSRRRRGRTRSHRRVDDGPGVHQAPDVPASTRSSTIPRSTRTSPGSWQSSCGLPVPTAGVFAPLLVRDRAIGAIVVHDKVLRRARGSALQRGRRQARRGGRRPGRGRRRPLAPGRAGHACVASSPPRRPSANGSPASSTTRPARRSRRCSSACARPRRRRTTRAATGARLAAGAGELDAAGRPPARGRAAAQGARRLRARRGARTARRRLPRAHRPRRAVPGAARRAAAVRDRDGPVPHRAGGTDERRQALEGDDGEHRARPQGGIGDGRDRGRRRGLHARRAGTRASASSACASASRWSAAG